MGATRTDPTLSSPGGAAQLHPVRQGYNIAGRYTLVHPLGRGGHGEVWLAEDSLSRQTVAVKLFRSGDHAHAARVRREIAVLRMLRLPGVVSMLDEGFDGEWPFMVMERVEGEPFPGRDSPSSWEQVADAAQRLLEIVGRIHAAGIIHRDLKPSNVLVAPDGRVTVLDFGLSFPQASTGDRLTMDFEFMGTPAFLAPEQLTGDSVGPETDLYAIAVMLYEALSGKLPHQHSAIRGMLAERLTRKPRPIEELVPSVPGPVAAAINQLLSIDPKDRPASAESVLHRLRAERESASRVLARLGDRAPIARAAEALCAGRSLDVLGPPGSGRTRFLDDLAQALIERGRTVLRARPESAPLASARAIVGEGARIEAADELNVVLDRVTSAIVERAAQGAIVLVDDLDRCDALSQRVFARVATRAAIARASVNEPMVHGESCARLGALRAQDIEPLFAGPERLFHLRSEGAQRLIERTDGLPRTLLDELDAWARAGLCRWDEGHVVIDRTALDRIALDPRPMRARATARPSRTAWTLPAHLQTVAQWLDLAGEAATTTVLVELTREPRWQVEAALDELEERGVLRLNDDRNPVLCARDGVEFAHESRSAAHRRLALALPRGKPGRFLHLLASGANEEPGGAEEVLREALARSEDLAREGRIGPATVILSDALRSVRALIDSRALDPSPLFVSWVELAIASNAQSPLDAVLYELTRVSSDRPLLAQLTALVRAALAVSIWDDRAASLIEAVAPFEDVRLELARATVRVLAARRVSLAAERERVESVLRAFEADTSALVRARCSQWLGRLSYRMGAFAQAAQHHRDAARIDPWLSQRVMAMLDAASASLESFDLVQAERDALEALGLAVESRNAMLEARAEWLLRAVAWRSDRALEVDHELIDAVALLGSRQLEALVCLSEGAVAWRNEQRELAAMYAERAYLRWTSVGEPFGSILAGALTHACGRPLPPEALDALIDRARRCTSPGVGLQALALLAESGVAVALDEGALALLTDSIPRDHWAQRMELFSAREAIERLRAVVTA